jgi:peroxiredoxin Q/BCP
MLPEGEPGRYTGECAKVRRKEGKMPTHSSDSTKAEIGGIAPDFELPTDGGGALRLADLRGRKVVLYFYPADDTEGCTIEAVNFTALLAEFERAGATVIGVSPDSQKSHDRFKLKHRLAHVLAADVDHKVIERYGLWGEKTMFGRKYMGVERATFLIGADGRIREAWRKVRVKGHAEAVLAAVREL